MPVEHQSYTPYMKAIEVFCSTVVDTCIIDKLQIMRMVSMQELFIKTVQEVEHIDGSVEIGGFYLKQKLNARYPSLQLVWHIKRNASESVLCKEGSSILLTCGRLKLIWRNWRAPIVNMRVKANGHNLNQIIIVKKVVDSCTLPVNIFRESSLAHQI